MTAHHPPRGDGELRTQPLRPRAGGGQPVPPFDARNPQRENPAQQQRNPAPRRSDHGNATHQQRPAEPGQRTGAPSTERRLPLRPQAPQRRGRLVLVAFLVVVALVIVAVCTVVARASSGASPAGPAGSTDPLPAGAARAAVNAVDAQATGGVEFGVAVLDRATGAETLGKAGSAQFYCASVLKLFLITDLLHQQEQGTITLDQDDNDEIRLALSQSDDAAMDSLWEDYDGPAAIKTLIGLAHLQDTQVPANINKTGQWGETLISARDVLAVYSYVLTQLNATDRNLVIGDLNNANPIGYQGFNQAFGLLGPTRDSATKAKQGWMSYQHRIMLHTTGVLDGKNQIVIAILSARPGTLDAYQPAEQQLDNATAALVKALGLKQNA